MLGALKKSLKGAAAVAAEGAVALASMVGIPFALALGKLFLAAVLTALALGVFMRFKGRKSRRVPSVTSMPGWYRPAVAVASLVEIAVLVEATNLPVRWDQPGFDRTNWILVLAALAIAYGAQIGWLKRMVHRKGSALSRVDAPDAP